MIVFVTCVVVVGGAAMVGALLMATAILVDAVAWPWRVMLWPLGVWGVAVVVGLTAQARRAARIRQQFDTEFDRFFDTER